MKPDDRAALNDLALGLQVAGSSRLNMAGKVPDSLYSAYAAAGYVLSDLGTVLEKWLERNK